MIDQIPAELLIVDPGELEKFNIAVEAVRSQLDIWVDGQFPIRTVQGLDNVDILRVIVRVLRACPDEGAADAAAGLEFIHDQAYRVLLRVDLSASHRALANGEWKAATVLAGSVIEALLLWVIEHKATPQDRQAAINAGLAANLIGAAPNANAQTWGLHELTEVSAQPPIVAITAATTASVRLARGFRNFIHPGRAQRSGAICDQGTALIALGALESVTRDLQARYP